MSTPPLRVFVVHDQPIKARMQAFAATVPLGGKPIEVIFREYDKQRSLDQNAAAWQVVTAISEQVWPNGEQFERETWWLLLKREFFGPEFIRLPDGSVVEQEPRSKWRNTKEFSGWIEFVFQYAAEHQVVLPHDVVRPTGEKGSR